MTNDNKPQDVSTNPCKDLPEGVSLFDHTKYNKDQKLRLLLSTFSDGLHRVGIMCNKIIEEHDREDPADPEIIATGLYNLVGQVGNHAQTIMGGQDMDFDDDDVTGSGKRKYIPVSEVKAALEAEYKLGTTSCDDEVNETIDNVLSALGYDISKDEG